MHRNNRIKLLQKIAKSKDVESLKGKYSIKHVNKVLQDMKKELSILNSKLNDAESKRDSYNEIIQNCKDRSDFVKREMLKCHDALQCADFNGADAVNFKNDEVLFSVDGGNRWGTYDPDTHSLYFGKAKPKKEEGDSESNDVSDANDSNNSEDVKLEDGFDFNITGPGGFNTGNGYGYL